MTGGHGWFIGREADGPEDVVKAVRENIKAGADLIKFIATGGVTRSLRAVTGELDRRGERSRGRAGDRGRSESDRDDRTVRTAPGLLGAGGVASHRPRE